MTELIGDNVEPSELRIPTIEGTRELGNAGDIFMSGNKLWFDNGTKVELITSA